MITNKSDTCLHCQGQKLVYVHTINGGIIHYLPGSSNYVQQSMVLSVECACSDCGLAYAMQSLLSPVHFHE